MTALGCSVLPRLEKEVKAVPAFLKFDKMRIGEHLHILSNEYASIEKNVGRCSDALKTLVACQEELLNSLIAVKRRSDGTTFQAAEALF